jgi:hypothetical protein
MQQANHHSSSLLNVIIYCHCRVSNKRGTPPSSAVLKPLLNTKLHAPRSETALR